MKKIILSLVIGFFLPTTIGAYSQNNQQQIVVPDRLNSSLHYDKPYVILISLDGFRHDYIEKYQARFLEKMNKVGVRADALIPSYPTITSPNLYTIVTGLYPAHHGLVGNYMYDPKRNERFSLRNSKAIQDSNWYGGTPIWSLAEQQQMLTACYFWPGSEAEVAGKYPTYYYPYSENHQLEQRIEEVVNWLSLPIEKRPHLITFYLPEVDAAGHKFGPDAIETSNAVQFVDQAIEKLTKAVTRTKLNVNYIVVSDHGMTQINEKELLKIPITIDPDQVEVVSSGTYVSLFVKEPTKINGIFEAIKKTRPKHYTAYLKADIPKKYHFSAENDRFGRIGDIVLMAEAPYYFSNNKANPGAHGYDASENMDMNAIFTAWGPQIQKAKKIDKFENIHIYPILTKLLGLETDEKIDGDERIALKILKP